MSKKVRCAILLLIAGSFATLILFSSDVLYRKMIAISTESMSATEQAYIQQFLTASFFNKQRVMAALGTMTVAVIICLLMQYAPRISAEFKTLRNWLKTQSRAFGMISLMAIVTGLLLLGLLIIPWLPIHSDEAYAFEYFTQRNPLISVLTYPAPNNHILFSFTSSLLHKIIPFELYALRLPSLCAVLGSLVVLLLRVHQRFGRSSAYWSIMIVFATFYPSFYAVQGRGYAFLLLFSSIWLLLIVSAIEKRRLELPIFTVLTAVAGFYTIPVFIYPYLVASILLLFYLPFRSWIRMQCLIGAISLLLYTPILYFFGFEVLIGNEFVESLSIADVWQRYPSYLLGFAHHYIPLILLTIFLLIRGDAWRNTSGRLFLGLVVFSASIPWLQHTFAPMRVFIYLIPIGVYALAETWSSRKISWWFFLPVILYSFVFSYQQYGRFNQYSVDAKDILHMASEQGSKKIYLLDGPRSIFNWYVDRSYTDLEFEFSLNRDPLNQELLEQSDQLFISEYRWEELDWSSYKMIDSTHYFYLFQLK